MATKLSRLNIRNHRLFLLMNHYFERLIGGARPTRVH
jgi:hypothetical protein